MKISTKLLTGSTISVGLVVAILIGNTVVVQQIRQNVREKSYQTTQTIKAVLETNNTLKSEIIVLKDIVLFKTKSTSTEILHAEFLDSLNQVEQLMPNSPEIALIRRRHQLLDNMAVQLTQRSASPTYLEDSQQYFRAINSFNQDIQLFLEQIIQRAYQERILLEQDLQNLYQVQRIISIVVVAIILMLLIGKFILIWQPTIKSIQNLQLGTAEIAAGNFDYRLNIHTGDEIEDLAQSFNDMAGKLSQSRETLMKNTELTNMNQRLELEIAERKQAELELQKALQELQQTQAQLIQTEKMSSLGQLVAGVAHEINNPVSFIYGNIIHANEYTEKLLELIHLYQQELSNPSAVIQEKIAEIDLEFLQEDLPKILSSMKMGSQRIQQIVLSLRNFSRLDEAEMKEVDIHEGIESTLLILQNRFKAKSQSYNIKIIREYGQLPLVECHAGQLNQVFMNIINNAVDALEGSVVSGQWSIVNGKTTNNERLTTNGPQITIRTEINHNNRVVIRIADNGPGITQQVMPKLFDPFFTTKPVGQGTGLGLSISYQIVVEKHSGVLRCESEIGKGTEFWIEIPLRQVQPEKLEHGFSAMLTREV
ncbi:Periplasmic Sensor Signal Transduction Histidine Kinase [Trichormus variabilis ATCC 29413]|uniref:histidine kinase n=2 Tax=Anabaena variabilis TaxID=264691 RepID=Q3M532_TRIV2|nr:MULTISPECIES: ATP-binding protein [Nostocaceae]ABA23904.1 Periplasmic Sensor Signal Transduction Histidine Kinase [Trichormus variabilis ATCC 29413]MBC1216596.1 HAMP domain-containing protein [Trichormus variabilis ARAD]MBC1255608.1 HAMP domain-containing protein [Trichormus variabilis V5]MBC1266728.1 HAMP domain-containing protein [Trichormus variabilis FSR]MBC1300477.1 HAMP domain-containing protein [Trichormus variabilis N2B]